MASALVGHTRSRADLVEEAAALERAHARDGFRLQRCSVGAGVAHVTRHLHQALAAGDVDEVDAAADEQDVRGLRTLAARGLELVAHVLDRAEEQRPVHAQDVELRAARRRIVHGREAAAAACDASGATGVSAGCVVRLR